jgi:polyketide biosynthesis enoyl-CoA hydratase PksH
LEANVEVFSDRANLQKIARYVSTGQFPWEAE